MTTMDYSRHSPFNEREGVWLTTAPESDDVTVGQSTMKRREIVTTSLTIASQSLRLTYFVSKKSETVSSVSTCTGSTVAAATPTLCRLGLYEEAENGDLTLIAATENDVNLWNAANTIFNRSFSVPVDIVQGRRYAVGILIVTAVATPTMHGNGTATSIVTAIPPKLAGQVSSQTDLPSSIANGSIANSGASTFVLILP